MVAIAIFAALAYVSVALIRIPVMFLTFDFKDVIVTVCGLFYGPLAAVTLAVVVPLLEFITISDTGVYGLIMNFLSSFAIAFTASLIYKFKKTLLGAIIGLVSGVFAVTAVMMLANLLITPYFMHAPVETVVSMIPTVLLPFNFTKAVLNAAVTLLLYKPISRILKKSRLSGREISDVAVEEEQKKGFDLRSVIVLTIALVITAAALSVMIFVLGGRISFFDIFKK
jgi:riboflavin transporter FmnP